MNSPASPIKLSGCFAGIICMLCFTILPEILLPDNSAVRVLVGFNRVKHPHVVGAFAAGPPERKVRGPLLFQFSRHQLVVRASRSTNW